VNGTSMDVVTRMRGTFWKYVGVPSAPVNAGRTPAARNWLAAYSAAMR
jgi:hypothetical protein